MLSIPTKMCILETGESARIRMTFHSLCELIAALNFWTDIVYGETGPKIYIHDYNLGEIHAEKYDVSARTKVGELINKYEHTAVVKKYAGVTIKFITLFSTTVSRIFNVMLCKLLQDLFKLQKMIT